MRLTRTGWAVLVGALCATGAGRTLGLDEVTLLGAAAAVGVVTSILFASGPLPRATARVDSARVPTGAAASITVTLVSRRTRPRGDLAVALTLGDGDTPSFDAGRFDAAGRSQVRLALPTDRRGIVHVRAVVVSRCDPFGLVRYTRRTELTRTCLIVLPRVSDLAPPRAGRDDRRLGDPHPATGMADQGDEFASLRPYARGDDLRRVHWASTARHAELVVRRLEPTLRERCTVVIDTRADLHDGESLEVLVRAAASVLTAATADNQATRLRTTTGFDSGLGTGPRHLEVLLDELATIETEHAPEPPRGTPRRNAATAGGHEVHLTTAAASRRIAEGQRLALDATVIAAADDAEFHAAWAAAMQPRKPRGARNRRRPAQPVGTS